jgi:hypothetical protein
MVTHLWRKREHLSERLATWQRRTEAELRSQLHNSCLQQSADFSLNFSLFWIMFWVVSKDFRAAAETPGVMRRPSLFERMPFGSALR